MAAKFDEKRERFVAFLIWAFLVAGAGVFLALKVLTKPADAPTVAVAQSGEVEPVLEKEGPAEETMEEEIDVTEEDLPTEAPETNVSPYAGMAQNANGTNSTTTYNATAHLMDDGLKYVYYKTMVWGTVKTDFEDFRSKVAETLADARGWTRMGLKFVEVEDGQDLNIIISDAENLEGYNGYCSGSLSCTSGFNEVIINDERWREGTEETADGLSTRDYQHMVVNHEMGHWLGHYSHIESCDVDGEVAPIMLQQSTGLRNCGEFNPWPLDSELWTLR